MINLPLDSAVIQNIFVLTTNNIARKETIKERLNHLNLKATFFDNSGFSASKGHLRIIQYLKENNVPYALILEDDACFMDCFKTLYPIVAEQANKRKWDLLYLGGNILTQKVSRYVDTHLMKPDMTYCCHAYFINSNAYEKCISALIKYPDLIVDDVFARENDLFLLLTNPMLVTQLPPDGTFQESLFVHQIMTQSYIVDDHRPKVYIT